MSNASDTEQEMGQRFKAELERVGLSVTSVAHTLKVARNTVYNWFDNASFSGLQLTALGELGLDIDRVLYPEDQRPVIRKLGGEDSLSSEDVAYQLGSTSPGITARSDGVVRFTYAGKQIEIDANDYEFVPVFDVEFGAGPARFIDFNEPPLAWDAFRKSWLRSKNLLGAQLFKATICGESMLPLLRDKDVELFNASDKVIRAGEIYGIRFGDENIVKYLRQLPGGLVEISSHNPQPQHAAFTVRAEEFGNGIEIVGRLVR